MMADASPVPRSPAPGPEHPGWEDLRRAAAAALQIVTLTVQDMRHALPADDVRTELARQACELLAAVSSRLEGIVMDEAVAAEREARAFEEGLAAGAAGRRCGRRNPGHLRDVSEGG